jgi:cysteine-rich repeat protein
VITALSLLLMGGVPAQAANLPSGFSEIQIGGAWNEAVGMQFTIDGRLFVWERGGRVWIVENGVKSASPFIDISEEVGGWRDFGLLGFALHPDFNNNGLFYLYYVVDRHHLMNFGTGAYSSGTNEYFAATQGRITSYRAIKPTGDPDYTNATTTDYATRLVIHGDAIGEGCPILYESHGTGHLVFGEDNSLLAACGDGASYSTTDVGSIGHTYYAQAIADGIMRPEENVGAYRSQMLSSLSGKILRIDPLTGNGFPSNPYFDGDPTSVRSKVWALGLRNPYRMVLKPNSGDHDPAQADPGTIYIGDVGWSTWEDLHVSNAPGQNFGWPAFEGLTVHNNYWTNSPENPDALNPLFNGGTCNQQNFEFTDLLQQATLDPSARFPNPCDGAQDVPVSVPTFFHARPKVDMRHGATGGARWGSFDGFDAIAVDVGTAQDPSGKSVPGPLFGSNTATAGFFYTGTSFPAFYHDKYFHAEWDHEWIKTFEMDISDEPVRIDDFLSNGGGIVFATMDPTNGDMYYISWTALVWRVRYLGSGNAPPTAVASASPVFGTTPLAVDFVGDASTDPEELALTYDWDFGDGTAHSSAANPSHVYADNGGLLEVKTVSLTVTDVGGANPDESDTTTLDIWLNNAAPAAAITSPVDGSLYTVVSSTPYALTATISDAETPTGNLLCEWQVSLGHNDHFHTDPLITTCAGNTEIAPLGCDPNATYWWRIELKVTDEHGLSTEVESNIYPDETGCPNIAPLAIDDAAAAPKGVAYGIDVLANDFDSDGTLDPSTVQIGSSPANGTITGIDVLTGVVTYVADPGPATADSFTYTVADEDGDASNTATVSITAYNNLPVATLSSPLEGDLFTGGQLLSIAGSATDPDDLSLLTYHWEIDRIENGVLVPAVYVHDGVSPPDYAIPVLGGPLDHISYRVTLTVTDAAGETGSDIAYIYPAVAPPGLPPIPDLQATPTSGSPDLLVDFDASASSDPDGDLLRYLWDFGDGSPQVSGAIVAHTYTGYATRTATLTVTDSMGVSNTAAVSIDTALGGVVGEYFDNMTLSGAPDLVRVDSFIDFNWAGGSPDPLISNNNYSVRWTGQIVPLHSEDYTLYISIDDGGRLWIDDVLVVDSWIDQSETEHASAPIALVAGVPADFRFEFYENGGDARARLRWSSASQAKQIIPAAQLQGASGGNQPPIAVTDSGSFGLGGTHFIDVLANDVDDQAQLDPSSLVLGSALHGTLSFDSVTGVVQYVNDGTLAAFDYFQYSVMDLAGAGSNTVSVLLTLNALCGDSVVVGAEACDDGNVLDGDCCSSACQFESNGASCDDANACTVTDACDGAGACLPGGPAVCDNGLFCDGVESCDTLLGCLPGAPPNVDDGVACTDDSCDEGTDSIVNAANDASCADGLFCNGDEICNPVLDCQAGTPPILDDAVACTVDGCDEAGDLVTHVPDDLACDDQDVCTADSCDEITGCANAPIPGCAPGVPLTTPPGFLVLALMLVATGGLAAQLRRERS